MPLSPQVSPSSPLLSDTSYDVEIPPCGLRDGWGNCYQGMFRARWGQHCAARQGSFTEQCTEPGNKCVPPGESSAQCGRDSFHYKVVDDTAPYIIRYDPPHQEKDVATSTHVTLTFNEAVAHISQTNLANQRRSILHRIGFFKLKPHHGVNSWGGENIVYLNATHPITKAPQVEWVAPNTVRLYPYPELLPGRRYTVTTHSGVGPNHAGLVQDDAGNAHIGLPQNVMYQFHTGYHAVTTHPERCENKMLYANGNYTAVLQVSSSKTCFDVNP